MPLLAIWLPFSLLWAGPLSEGAGSIFVPASEENGESEVTAPDGLSDDEWLRVESAPPPTDDEWLWMDRGGAGEPDRDPAEAAVRRNGGEKVSAAPGPAVSADEISDFNEFLNVREGAEFDYQGQTYMWRDGVPQVRGPDGVFRPIKIPDRLYEEYGNQRWLTQAEDGSIYIDVLPRILARIAFAYDSAEIEEKSYPLLDAIGESLTTPGLANRQLIIIGHTDNRGSAAYNQALSRRRAQSVAAYLTQRHQIGSDRLILHGYGAERPVADNETDEGRALNRRVEFILPGPPH